MEGKPACSVSGKIMCFVGALVLIAVGSGIFVEWEAWSGYKKFSASDYDVQVTLDDSTVVTLKPDQYVKVFRVLKRVDIVDSSKQNREVYFNPRSIAIHRKK